MKKAVAVILILAMTSVFACLPASAEKINVAQGAAYTVVSYAANDRSYSKDTCDDSVLTDGVYGSINIFNSGLWAGFYRAVGRRITLDLGSVCAVESFNVRFIQQKPWGIYAPRRFCVYISENGVDFMLAKSLTNPLPTMADLSLAEYTGSFDKKYNARYIAFEFNVSVSTYCDEIEVFGEKNTSGTAVSDFVASATDKGLLPRDALDGVHDIVCFHAGYYPSDETLVNNTVEYFMPYIGYRDANGKLADTMFDAVMFLILQGSCPSGGNLTIAGEETVKTDWESLLDSFFSEEYNLKALDTATAQLKTELSLPETHKTAVYLSVPYPKIGNIDFGDIDGDGKSDKIKTYDDCLKVLDWYFTELFSRWENGNYLNLELKGFFFFSEAIENTSFDYEERLAVDFVDYVHKEGYQAVMIPFYQAQGIEELDKYNFDAALMQPNLSFNEALQDDPEGTMADFVQTAEKYGLGIQMELSHDFRWEPETYGKLFEQYLISSANSGMMTDTIHAYYNGAGPGMFYTCHNSDKPYSRWIYDCTYKFIKGTLDFSLPQGDTTEEISITAIGRERVKTETGLTGDWFYEHKFTKNASNGFVTVLADKSSYSYTADRRFAGEDYFEIEFSANGKVVKTVKVSVTVESDESGVVSTVSEASEPTENEEKTDLSFVIYIIIGLAAIGLAVLVIKLFVIKKEENYKE